MGKERVEFEIEPLVMKILREDSGYSIDEVAQKLNTTKEKIETSEKTKTKFTLLQIEKLSTKFKRPLAAFFSNFITKLPGSTDYRVNRQRKIPPTVYLAKRRAYYLSSKIAELNNRKSQIPQFSSILGPEKLAGEFKKYLGIEIVKNKKPEKTLSYYKNILEEKLSIIIIEYPFKADDVRAFSIPSSLSVIVLNEDDNRKIKLFSLFHEVCHLIRKDSGICSIDIETGSQDSERFCNHFSAEFLVPQDDFRLEMKKFSFIDEGTVTKLSEIYSVNKQVIMLRLLWLNYIEKQKYEEFKISKPEKLQKKKLGRRNWDKIFYNRVGNLALSEVKNTYYKGEISFSDVMDTLNIKTKYIEKFLVK